MKHNFKKIVLVAVVVATAGYGVYENQKQETMPDVMLANVEALTELVPHAIKVLIIVLCPKQ